MNTARSTPVAPQVESWSFDPVHSTIQFRVRHLVISKVTGRFARWSGSLLLGGPDLADSKVEVSIDAASVDTAEPQRDAEEPADRRVAAGLSDAVRVGRHVVGPVAAILLYHDADHTGAQEHEVEPMVELGAGVETLDRGDIHDLVAGRAPRAAVTGVTSVPEQAGEREL